MERECKEESCSRHEFDEVFDLEELSGADLQKQTRAGEKEWKMLTNRCSFRPCSESNTKTCRNIWNDFRCMCKEGWTGKECTEDVDECQNESWCANGGVCTNTEGSFTCECAPGWGGAQCEEDVNECDSDPCSNDGTCENTQGSFYCTCVSGWTGALCEEDVNECEETDPCSLANQYCMNTPGSYKCACKGGWAGDDCDQDFDECAALKPCKHGAVCSTPQFNSFSCTCPEIGCNNYVAPEVDETDSEEDDMEDVESITDINETTAGGVTISNGSDNDEYATDAPSENVESVTDDYSSYY